MEIEVSENFQLRAIYPNGAVIRTKRVHVDELWKNNVYFDFALLQLMNPAARCQLQFGLTESMLAVRVWEGGEWKHWSPTSYVAQAEAVMGRSASQDKEERRHELFHHLANTGPEYYDVPIQVLDTRSPL